MLAVIRFFAAVAALKIGSNKKRLMLLGRKINVLNAGPAALKISYRTIERDKMLKDRIEERKKIRAEIAERSAIAGHHWSETLLLIGESLDDYIEQRIETDKVLEGILKDIQGEIAGVRIATGDNGQ